ncbi:ABC transporter substrate-binding protein [Azospirillum sp. sgz302134]
MAPEEVKVRWRERLAGLSKRSLFLVFLGIAGTVAVLLSLATRIAFDRTPDTEIRIGVVAPLTGPSAALGRSIREGAELFAAQINRAGGVNGMPLRVMAVDDGDDPATARKAAERIAAAGVVGVVGHWSGEAAAAAAEVYRAAGVPALTPAPRTASSSSGAPENEPGIFHVSFDRTFETRFLANYVRNVLGEKMVSIIHQRRPEDEALAKTFDEVMQRFGTRVLNRWDFDPAAPDAAAQLDQIAAEIRDKRITGSVFVLADPVPAAKALAALRQGSVKNRAFGLRGLATNAFLDAFRESWTAQGTPASGLNGTLTTTPLLFDTAGETAQTFRAEYMRAHRVPPDWLVASAYESARLLHEGLNLRRGQTGDLSDMKALRARIRTALAQPGRTHDGVLGPLSFDAAGAAAPKAVVGVFDGTSLIASLTQLSPIREENIGNYLEELVAGRALYVNDRFMYKTNVVYTGVNLEKISNFDPNAGTVDIAFNLWFRWRGDLTPQDVVFNNAVTPIRLEKPEREVQAGDMLYRSYRLKGTFYTNYSQAERVYGTHVVGVAFRHRTLAQNNLMYVSDVLGMNLNTGGALRDAVASSFEAGRADAGNAEDGSLLRRVANWFAQSGGGADPLVEMLTRLRALAGAPGWAVGRAWISQDVFERISEGDPAFVGFGKPQPVFSQLDMGAVLKADAFDIRDHLPSSSFIYIAIFSLVGSVLASLLDRKDRGQFWRMQTLGLRAICWPLLLMSAGNMALDYALVNVPSNTVDIIVAVYSALWWLVPARLLGITLERFVWVPLEMKTGRKIPNVVRMFARLVVYVLAILGIVAFVFAKPITSLLATSGLMAMIIGLAVQANIANVFSGIVLNMERPFKVGDTIKLNGTVGKVVDITWRTTRLRAEEGHMMALANGKVSEAEIHNMSDIQDAFMRVSFFTHPQYEPERVVRIVREALDTLPEITAPGAPVSRALFVGVECAGGVWVARYDATFSAPGLARRVLMSDELRRTVWHRFCQEGIRWTNPPGEEEEPASAVPAIAAGRVEQPA